MQRFTRPTTQQMPRYFGRYRERYQGRHLAILAFLSLAGLSLASCAGTPWGEQLGRAVAPVIPETSDAATSADTPAASLDETPVPDEIPADPTPAANVLDNILPDLGEPVSEIDPDDPIAILVAAGVLDEVVRPGSIRRSEFARWLVQSHNIAFADQPSRQLLLDREATPYFLDVPEDHPDFRYVQALTHGGYIEIPAERLFQPDLILTRALLIDWKVQLDWQGRIPGMQDAAETWDFIDAAQIPTFAQDAVAADFEQPQLIRRVFGADLTRLEPQAPVSRTEAATALLLWGLDNQPLWAEAGLPDRAPANTTEADEPRGTTEEANREPERVPELTDRELPNDVELDTEAMATPPASDEALPEEARNEPAPPPAEGGFITPRD